MTSESLSSFSSSNQRPAWSWKIQNFSTPQTYAAKSSAGSKGQSSASTGVVTQVNTAASPLSSSLQHDASKALEPKRKKSKRRRLNRAEAEIRDEIAEQVALNLQLDQLGALYPDADTPFEDEVDAVKRLLPYHIYQNPKLDLDEMRGSKGKSKATDIDIIRDEISETKFALESHQRLRSLEKRLRQAQLRPGKEINPHSQVIALHRMVLEGDHVATAALEHELSSARAELDKIVKAQRAAKTAASRTAASTPFQPPTTPFYGYNTSSFGTSTSQSFSNYYGSYTYPYGQSFLPGATYTPTKPAAPSIPGAASFQANVAANGQRIQPSVPSSAATQSESGSSATPVEMRPPPVAIPLQLPVTSLPALQALGILPVPKASLPPPIEPQPAAVLLGSSNNGTMLSLEINAAQLQAPQMSGLAILLSNLVKLSGGTGSSGSSTSQTVSSSTAGDANLGGTK